MFKLEKNANEVIETLLGMDKAVFHLGHAAFIIFITITHYDSIRAYSVYILIDVVSTYTQFCTFASSFDFSSGQTQLL